MESGIDLMKKKKLTQNMTGKKVQRKVHALLF
jgi:hypothetical protein